MNESKPITHLLTQREREILVLISQGMLSKQIAHHLTISENTVSNHRKNMLLKTQTKSSAELIHLYSKYS